MNRVYCTPEGAAMFTVPEDDVAAARRLLALVPETFDAVLAVPITLPPETGFLFRFERAGARAIALVKPQHYLDHPDQFRALLRQVDEFLMRTHARDN